MNSYENFCSFDFAICFPFLVFGYGYYADVSFLIFTHNDSIDDVVVDIFVCNFFTVCFIFH